jgi:hypothetical protein
LRTDEQSRLAGSSALTLDPPLRSTVAQARFIQQQNHVRLIIDLPRWPWLMKPFCELSEQAFWLMPDITSEIVPTDARG